MGYLLEKTKHHNGRVYEFIKWPYMLPLLSVHWDTYHWYDWRGRYHYGVDMGTPGLYMKPVYATGAGTVQSAGYSNSGYGNWVIIGHGNNAGWQVQSLYAHLYRVDCYTGKKVKKGDIIGLMGGHPKDAPYCGSTTSPHLHFEFRLNGRAVDPMPFLNDTFALQLDNRNAYYYDYHSEERNSVWHKYLSKAPFVSQGLLGEQLYNGAWMAAKDLIDYKFKVPSHLVNGNGYSPIREVANYNNFDTTWLAPEKKIVLTRRRMT